MPRYFFHIRDGSEFSPDREGQEMKNADEARREAMKAAREMASERLLHGGSMTHKQIEIADETGRVVEVVSARDVLLQNGELRPYSDDITR